MTYVIESYEDSNGLIADIEQEKYESCYRLEILQPIDECMGLLVFKGTYLTIPNARRAMRRQMNAPITKTYDCKSKEDLL